MDIKKFNFPEIQGLDIAFSTVKTDKQLLSEAISRGFYCGTTKYNDLFSKLFFTGGKLNFKDDIDPDFKKRATNYLRAIMASFEPRHEEKEAISALLLSELVECEK